MKFLYRARTKEGKLISGKIEASSKEAALDLLYKKEFFVTNLEEEKKPILLRQISLFSQVSPKDIVLFFRQLATMISAKVQVIEAFDTLAAQTTNPILKEIIFEMGRKIEAGSSISESLFSYQKFFSPVLIAIIRAGEKTGKLSEVLNYLSNYLEKDYNTKSKLKGALIYPALVITLGIAVIFLLMFFVIPSFEELIRESEAPPPLVTKIVFSIFYFLRKNFIFILLGIVFLFLLIYYYRKTPQGKKFFDRLLLRTPILGRILKYSFVIRFSETLDLMISAGIMIDEAIELEEEIIDNVLYKKAISEIKEGIRKGLPISSISSLFPDLFPPFFNQMVLTGEKTGSLAKCLKESANFFQAENERLIENSLRLLEPILIVFLGIGVGGIVATVLVPLYSIISSF